MIKIHAFPRMRDSDPRRSTTLRVRSRSALSIQDEFNKPDALITALSEYRNDPSSPNSEGIPLPAGPGELARLHASLSGVTPESNPRTAKLLGSSTRKVAQKVIEEAGEVALETVKHRARGVVCESADLLYTSWCSGNAPASTPRRSGAR